jgi:general secretion pathway protein G
MARPRHAHRLASHTPLAGLSRRAAGAFTLVEILIVVVIIGILATVVIPQFTSASHQARENTLKDDLRYLRNQVQVYTAQHLDVAPGFPPGNPGGSPSSTYFISQMTQPTNASGATGAAGAAYPFGPYLSKVPANPVNGLDTIKVVTGAGMPTPDDSTGWIYNPQTRRIIANIAANDAAGVPYVSY